jgi:nucleoside-diphosphate-sugar epimerase
VANSLFLAGATGAVGRRLVPILRREGWRVIGTTRSAKKVAEMQALGIEPVVVDVFDREQLLKAVEDAQPEAVMHQLTDLPVGLAPDQMKEALDRTARLRVEGTRNLVAAAVAAGSGRIVAQSIAFVYAEGPLPHVEHDELDVGSNDAMAATTRAVASLERQVLEAPLAGVVLRYGLLYGPGTGFDKPAGTCPVHVDAAAWAAFLALKPGIQGIFNIAEDDGYASSEKAKKGLCWTADWRLDS